VTTHNVLE
jgi:AcrR family transcriptional regulator